MLYLSQHDLKVPLPATNQLEEANAMLYPQPAAEHYDRVDERHAHQMRAAIRDFFAETEPLRKSFHRYKCYNHVNVQE